MDKRFKYLSFIDTDCREQYITKLFKLIPNKENKDIKDDNLVIKRGGKLVVWRKDIHL